MSLLQLRVDFTEQAQGNRVRYQLGSLFYEFLFKYNAISGMWFFDLYDDAGALIVAGVSLSVSETTTGDGVIDLLSAVRYKPDLPPGRLFAYDTGGTWTEAGALDIDSRVVLLYEDQA